jgi:hypothetical protein
MPIKPLTAIVALCLVALVVGAAYIDSRNNPTTPFSPVAWVQGEGSREDRPTIRQRMLSDLLARYRLVGMSRDSLELLLGPRRTDKFATYALAYWLGPEPSYLPIDSEWLVVALDSSGHVSHYEVVTD